MGYYPVIKYAFSSVEAILNLTWLFRAESDYVPMYHIDYIEQLHV